MKSFPKISVIVPVYNVENYLSSCLRSLTNQTYTNYEVILVNDGSDDNSLETCEYFSNNYNNFKFYTQSNKGVSAARNFGIKNAKGDWLTFVDADDLVNTNYLKILADGISNPKVDFVVGGITIDYISEGYSIVNYPSKHNYSSSKTIQEKLYNIEKNGLLNPPVSKLYKIDIIRDKNIEFNEQLRNGEDLVFNCQYFEHINDVMLLNNAPYFYIKRDIISSVNRYDKQLNKMVYICNIERYKLYEKLDMFSKNKYFNLYKEKYVDYILSLIPNMYRKDSNLNSLDKFKQFKNILNDSYFNHYKRSYNKDNFSFKIFFFLSKTENPYLLNFTYGILFFIRNHFSKIYKKIRKNKNQK